MHLIDRLVQFRAEIQAIRRDIHAHPELCYDEHRTSDLVARMLASWNIEVHRGLAGTGVVGVIRNGTGPRMVGLRADMDALPIAEANRFDHRSVHPGKMHACGHDGHVAMLLAAARYLAEMRPFSGTVVLVFQPAEEGGGGARRMVNEGLFKQFPVDAIFGMHNWPGMPVGQFGTRAGALMASSNEFEIRVDGRGSHAAMPHLGIDPVFVAVQIAQGLQGIVTRVKKPVDAAVLSITMIHAGAATNVVPDRATIDGTVRTFDGAVTDLIEQRMRQVAQGTAAAHGARAEVDFVRNYPPTVNHASATEFACNVLDDIVGAGNVQREIEPTMGAEDFSFLLQARPGAFLFIGNGGGDHRGIDHGPGPCMLHNASYDFNDELIPLGATFWVRLVEKFLGNPGTA